MNYLTSWQKLKKKVLSRSGNPDQQSSSNGKVPFNKDLLGVDLFCHLTYMSAIATSNIPRHLLFKNAAAQPYTSSRYLRDVCFLTENLNYDYSEACRMVGEATKEEQPRALLLRMANSLSSGENEADFLGHEAYVIGETYGDEYERNMENLKKWTDAYVALILSGALVVVICIVSMLIFPMDPKLIAALTSVMLLSVLAAGWIIYRASPKEIKTHALKYISREQEISRTLFRFTVPIVLVVLPILLISQVPMGWIMILIGILILPVGFFMIVDDRKIDKKDYDICGFLRSLGGVSKAIGTTVNEALGRLDFNALHSLKKLARNLDGALSLSITPALCWQKFVGESGSEQVNRSVKIFQDAVSLGGDPEVIGTQSSQFAMKVALLRDKRKLVSSGFSYLCIVMHATIVILLVGIYEILVGFSNAIAEIGGIDTGGVEGLVGLPAFQLASGDGQLNLLHSMSLAMIVVLTLVNGVTIKIVEGGNNYKALFYIGVTMVISGLCLVSVPGMVSSMFGALEVGG